MLFIIIILIQACKEAKENSNIEDFTFSSQDFKAENQYTIKCNNKKYNNLYLYIIKKTYSDQNYQCELIKFNLRVEDHIADFQIDEKTYFATFIVFNKGSEYNELYRREAIVKKRDNTLSLYAYYELLYIAKPDEYLKIFSEAQTQYPDDFGIYLVKWQYEGMNGRASRDNLKNDLNYIQNKKTNSGERNLILSMGYKLLKNSSKQTMYFALASESKINILNNDIITSAINDVLEIGKQNNLNMRPNESNLINLLENNPNSYFTLRNIVSSSKSIYDSSLIKLINQNLNDDEFYYFELLESKLTRLTFSFLPDSSKEISEIIDIFKRSYANNQNGVSGCNSVFMPKEASLLEVAFWANYKSELYNSAIETCLRKIEIFKKNYNYSIINYEYERIVDIYQNKLHEIDSALIYLFEGEEVSLKKSKINDAFMNIFLQNKENNKQTFLEWKSTTKTRLMSANAKGKSNSSIDNLENIILQDGPSFNLLHPSKNLILFFYSFNCGPCKILFEQMTNAKIMELRKKNIELIFIAQDKVDLIDKIKLKYKLNYKMVKNAKQIFDKYSVSAVPVLIYINTEGKILNKINGLSENWSLEETLEFFE